VMTGVATGRERGADPGGHRGTGHRQPRTGPADRGGAEWRATALTYGLILGDRDLVGLTVNVGVSRRRAPGPALACVGVGGRFR
jgi:hypothetical protein